MHAVAAASVRHGLNVTKLSGGWIEQRGGFEDWALLKAAFLSSCCIFLKRQGLFFNKKKKHNYVSCGGRDYARFRIYTMCFFFLLIA